MEASSSGGDPPAGGAPGPSREELLASLTSDATLAIANGAKQKQAKKDAATKRLSNAGKIEAIYKSTDSLKQSIHLLDEPQGQMQILR